MEEQVDSKNLQWMPGETSEHAYQLRVADELPSGEYQLKLKLVAPGVDRDVRLALKAELLDKDGYYRVGKIRVEQ